MCDILNYHENMDSNGNLSSNDEKHIKLIENNKMVAFQLCSCSQILSSKQQNINVSFDIKFISRKWKKDIFVPIQMFVCGHVCVLLCCRLVYNDKGMVISKQIDVLLVTYRREIFGVHNSEVVLMCVIAVSYTHLTLPTKA